VPPAPWDEDRLAGVLDELVDLQLGVRTTHPGDHINEVVYRLVVLSFQQLLPALHNRLRSAGGEQDPQLPPRQYRIPCGGAQRINVHTSTRTAWTQEEPAVGRPAPLPH